MKFTVSLACAAAVVLALPISASAQPQDDDFPQRYTLRTSGGTCLTHDQWGMGGNGKDLLFTRPCGELGQYWSRFRHEGTPAVVWKVTDDSGFTCVNADNRKGHENTRFNFYGCEADNGRQMVRFLPVREDRVQLSVHDGWCARLLDDASKFGVELGEARCDASDSRQVFEVIRREGLPVGENWPVPPMQP